MEIILASASPRRRELLYNMGIRDFTVRPAAFDEGTVRETDPRERVRRIAEGKALAVAAVHWDALVIAADTLVFLDGAPLGKPRDEDEAARMLRRLSGREHQVATGLAVHYGGRLLSSVEVTDVRFRALTEEEIRRYVATGEPMDKAGAYGIQGLGGLLVSGITGDYFNVVGLPVCRLGCVLRELGLDII